MLEQDKIIKINIEEEMKLSYIDYSISVIVSRALPDVRDGFKPVHRRILYAAYGLSMFNDKPYKKSAYLSNNIIRNIDFRQIRLRQKHGHFPIRILKQNNMVMPYIAIIINRSIHPIQVAFNK